MSTYSTLTYRIVGLDLLFGFANQVISVEALSPDGPENIWVGRIYGIRSREDGRPWVKVFWYYSPSDMVQEHSSL